MFEHFTRNGYRNFSTGKIHHNGHEDFTIFHNPDGFPGFGSKPNFGPIILQQLNLGLNHRRKSRTIIHNIDPISTHNNRIDNAIPGPI